MLDNLPSNSNKAKKKQQKKVEPIVTGKVSVHKKSMPKKLMETLFNSDIKTAKQHMIDDFAIPYVRDFIFNGFHDFIDTIFNGADSGRSYSYRPGSSSRTQYEKYFYKSAGGASKPASGYVANSKSVYEVFEICFEERGEAERILDEMRDIIEECESVSVNDYYELVGKTNELGASTDPEWGWRDLSRVTISMVRRPERGYIINLPRTESLK